MVKFSGKGLAPEELIQSLPFMIAVAGGAGMTVILATRFGFPVSTTHALLGAIVGSTLLATGGNMNPTPLLNNFVLPLLLSPIAALLLAALLYRLQHKLSVFNQPLCLCVEQPDSLVLADSANTLMAVDLPADLSSLSMASQAACAERDVGVILGFDAGRMCNSLHFCSVGAVCFARSLNDTPKIAALLLLAPGFSLQWIIVVIAVAMLLGGLLNARRVAETMSHKIVPITPAQGLSANLTTALLVIFASKFGMPLSTRPMFQSALCSA
jgi:PiT family inorganic phosphate transporter